MKKLLLTSFLVIALAALSFSLVSCTQPQECTHGELKECANGSINYCVNGYWQIDCE